MVGVQELQQNGEVKMQQDARNYLFHNCTRNEWTENLVQKDTQ